MSTEPRVPSARAPGRPGPRSVGFGTDTAVRLLEGADLIDLGDGCWGVSSPDNPGFHWGTFVTVPPALAAPEEAERRFRSAFPQAGHVAIGVDSDEALVRHTDAYDPPDHVLTATPQDVDQHLRAIPEDVVALRPLRTAGDFEQSRELRMAGAGPGLGDPVDVRLFLQRRTRALQRATATGRCVMLGAFVGDVLLAQAGVADVGDGTARYQDVVTLPTARRRGLAGALVVEAAAHAASRWGCRHLVIVADPAGPALGLYRRLGFRRVAVQTGVSRPVS